MGENIHQIRWTMPLTRLELAWISPPEPKSGVSAYFTTRANTDEFVGFPPTCRFGDCLFRPTELFYSCYLSHFREVLALQPTLRNLFPLTIAE